MFTEKTLKTYNLYLSKVKNQNLIDIMYANHYNHVQMINKYKLIPNKLMQQKIVIIIWLH